MEESAKQKQKIKQTMSWEAGLEGIVMMSNMFSLKFHLISFNTSHLWSQSMTIYKTFHSPDAGQLLIIWLWQPVNKKFFMESTTLQIKHFFLFLHILCP